VGIHSARSRKSTVRVAERREEKEEAAAHDLQVAVEPIDAVWRGWSAVDGNSIFR